MNDNFDKKNEQEKKVNKSLWSSCLITLIVFVLIAGFIVSLTKHVYWLTVIFAGCFLLSLESILLIQEFEKKRKRHLVLPLIICAIGVCTVICGIILKVNPDGFKKFALKNAPLAVFLLLFMIGMGLILSALTEPKRMRRYCTVKVKGVCVDLQVSLTSPNKGRRSYAPIYEFYYAGETRRIMESEYSNFANPQVGEEREIYLDVESLDEIYEPIRASKINRMTLILGACFVAATVLGMIMVYVIKL